MATVSDLVAQARKADARMRTMERNTRLGLYQGRNSGGDTTLHREKRDAAVSELVERAVHQDDRYLKKLAGWLTAEFHLARRVSEARDNDQARPELRERLAAVRRELRKAA